MQTINLFETAGGDDLNAVIDCINKTFCEGEALSKALCLTLQEFGPFVELFTTRSIKNGHTLKASTNKGILCGCLVAEDFSLLPPEGSKSLDPKLDPVFAILEQLDQQFRITSPVKPVEILHILMVGVYPEASGQSIGLQLLKRMEDIAKKQGYRGLIAEATGPISQNIFKKSGYETLETISYRNYLFRNQLPFMGILECDSCDLVFKALT